MKMKTMIFAVAMFVCGTLAAQAQETQMSQVVTETKTHPFQLSLFDPVQIIDNEESVTGLGINLLYGRNHDFTGFDIGLFNRVDNNLKGYSLAGINYVGGEVVGAQEGLVAIADTVKGAQGGLVAYTKGSVLGLQGGLVTVSDSVEGFGFGLVNYTKSVEGIQIGIVNITGHLRGIQIGLVNVATEKEHFQFVPIINANW